MHDFADIAKLALLGATILLVSRTSQWLRHLGCACGLCAMTLAVLDIEINATAPVWLTDALTSIAWLFVAAVLVVSVRRAIRR